MTKILTHPSFMLGIQYKGLLSDKICNQFCVPAYSHLNLD
jgi:hypothetical protein